LRRTPRAKVIPGRRAIMAFGARRLRAGSLDIRVLADAFKRR